MAKGTQIDKLYISIGVDNDELQVGLAKTDTTVKEAIAKLNAEAKNLKLETNIKLNNLEGVGTQLDKLKVKYQALEKEIEIASQKQTIAQKVLSFNQSQYGNDSGLTKKAATTLLYREQDLAKLRAEYRGIGEELKKLDNAGNLSKFQMGMNKAKESAGKLSSNVTLLSTKWAAFLAVAGTAGGLLTITDSAIKAGESLYKLQQRTHLSTAEAVKLNNVLKFCGTDADAVIPIITRLDKSVQSAGANGNATTNALKRYGVTLTDNNGHLLSYTQQLQNLAKGYQNAKKNGTELDYATEVLGAKGQALIPVFENLGDALKATANIKATGLLDPKEAHETYLEYMQLQAEIGQLQMALGAALMPVAKELMPEITDGLTELVTGIKNNKDEIKSAVEGWGEAFVSVAKAAGGAATAVGEVYKAVHDSDTAKGLRNDDEILKQSHPNADIDRGKTWAGISGAIIGGIGGGVLSGGIGAGAGALIGSEIAGDIYTEIGKATTLFKTWDYAKQRIELEKQEKQALQDFADQQQKKTENEKSDSEATKQNAEAQKQAAEAEKIRIKATEELNKSIYQLSHNDKDNALHAIDEQVKQYEKAGVAPDLVSQFKNLSYGKVEREFYRNVTKPMADAFKTDLQRSLDDVDFQAQDYLQKGASRQDVNAWINQRKKQITAEWDRQVAEQIDSIWMDEYQKQLQRIDHEKDAWIQKGLEEVKATQWAEERKAQLQQDEAVKALTTQRKYLKEYRKAMQGLYGGDTAEEREQLAISKLTQMRRKELGIRPNDFISGSELQAFQSVMNRAFNNLGVTDIRGASQPIQSGAYQGTYAGVRDGIQIIRGVISQNVNSNENGQIQQMSYTVGEAVRNGIQNGFSNLGLQEIGGAVNTLQNATMQINENLARVNFDEVSTAMQEGTRQLSDIVSTLSSLKSDTDSKSPTYNYTINCSVNNPNVWDNAALNEVSEKVSGKILDKVEMSNSYFNA